MNKQFKLNEKLIKNLESNNITKYTQIQEQAIPLILNKENVLGIAQTGTGKTLAFSLPLINNLMEEQEYETPRAIIIAPTRDLAMQIFEAVKVFTKGTKIVPKLFIGGRDVQRDVKICRNEAFDIIVANPGRLMDLAIKRRVLELDNIKTIILDEADQMLDMGFLPDIKKIYHAIGKHIDQSLLFSATMPREIIKLAEEFLGKEYQTVKVNPEFNVFDNMEQIAYHIKPKQRVDVLIAIAKKHKDSQAIIFTRTRREAKVLEGIFKDHKISANSIHSDKSQSQRARVLEDFKKGKLNFLIATDVMARGIDVKNLPLVINYNLPDSNENYVHRIGRTARAGAKGIALTIIATSELNSLKKIERMTNYPITLIELDDSDLEITTEIGSITRMNSESSGGRRSSGDRSRNSRGNDRGSRDRGRGRPSYKDRNDNFVKNLRNNHENKDNDDVFGKSRNSGYDRSSGSFRRDSGDSRNDGGYDRSSRGPRRDSGDSRNDGGYDRSSRGPRRDSRNDGGYDRSSRGPRRDSRNDRPSRGSSDSRKDFGDSRNDRPSRGSSDSRKDFGDSRNGRYNDRPSRGSSDSRNGRYNDRPSRGSSDSRNSGFGRSKSFDSKDSGRQEFKASRGGASGFTSKREKK